MIRVDNDLFGDARAANAFGWRASALLADLVGSGTVRYEEIVRVLYDPRTNQISELKVQIRLH